MRSRSIETTWPLVTVAVMGALVTACGNHQSAMPAPAQTQAAQPVSQPEVVAQPEVATVDLRVVRVAAPASSEPELSNMKLAQAGSSKIGVPVDLRYQIDGDAMAGQSVTVHLAAVPRVAGTNLAVSIKQEPGIEFPKETLNAQKADAATAYRQQVRLTRAAGGPQELRVLVTMDFPIGTGFTYFTVPLGGSTGSKQPVDRLQ